MPQYLILGVIMLRAARWGHIAEKLSFSRKFFVRAQQIVLITETSGAEDRGRGRERGGGGLLCPLVPAAPAWGPAFARTLRQGRQRALPKGIWATGVPPRPGYPELWYDTGTERRPPGRFLPQ